MNEVTEAPQIVYVKATGNGYAVAALVIGLISALIAGSMFILFPVGLAGGFTAFVLAVIGWRKGRDPMAGRKTMAKWATAISVIAFTFGVWGAVVVNSAVNDFNKSINQSLNCVNTAQTLDAAENC